MDFGGEGKCEEIHISTGQKDISHEKNLVLTRKKNRFDVKKCIRTSLPKVFVFHFFNFF